MESEHFAEYQIVLVEIGCVRSHVLKCIRCGPSGSKPGHEAFDC